MGRERDSEFCQGGKRCPEELSEYGNGFQITDPDKRAEVSVSMAWQRR